MESLTPFRLKTDTGSFTGRRRRTQGYVRLQNISEPVFGQFTSMCLKNLFAGGHYNLNRCAGPNRGGRCLSVLNSELQELSLLSISTLEFLVPEMPALQDASGQLQGAVGVTGLTGPDTLPPALWCRSI